jgi:hypothetical protein
MFNQITADYLLVDDSKNTKIRESLTAPKRIKNQFLAGGGED